MSEPRTAPEASGSELEEFFTTGTPAYPVETTGPETVVITEETIVRALHGAFCCAGIDSPEAGGYVHNPDCPVIPMAVTPAAERTVAPGRPHVAGEVPEPLRSRVRQGLLAQLLFAAKHLAERNAEPLGENARFCSECQFAELPGEVDLSHTRTCSTGRVLRLLAELQAESEDDFTSPGKETALDGKDRLDDRMRLGGLFGEPLQVSMPPDNKAGNVYVLDRDKQPVALMMAIGRVSAVDLAFRIVDSVNSCAPKGGAR